MTQEQKHKNNSSIIGVIIGELMLIPLYPILPLTLFIILASAWSIFTIFVIIAVLYYNKTHKSNTINDKE